MTPPQELIERSLSIHGDTLFRAALLIAGDAQGAEGLLRATVADLLAAPPLAPPDEADLLARLLAAARAAEARRPGKRRPTADLSPIERSLARMPVERRLALGLHLLLGYDVARLARVLASDQPAARASLIDAMHAVAPAARVSLTDRTSGDHCIAVREALVDPAGRLHHAPAIRGHLAGCAHCRAFDQAWGEVSQAAETALRASLRDRTLPADLEARLLALARPARRRLSPSLRFALPPLAVLLIVAALVLPGITRRPVTVVDREGAAPADPQDLISRSLEIYAHPAAAGGPIWHARYETFWYLDNNTLAPLHADLWLDRTNPARHRIQLTHAAGGAPYEIQIGSGIDRLYYALDGLYARALYGGLPLRAIQDAPALISSIADSTAQSQALAERISYGVWDIPPFYLRQARQASDLRVLGRQRDGDRSVQILSFSGVSPMGRPADAPGATAEKVTILLALDMADGRLRSATEIAGPPGGTQTSRSTWKLLSEETFGSIAEAGNPFDIDRAWNGRGSFPEPRSYRSADHAVPLISADQLADPASFLDFTGTTLWVPATAPAGVERALLIFPSASDQRMPQALIYLGPDRRLIIRFNAGSIIGGEQIERGLWHAQIEPGRARRYRAALEQAGTARLLIDAHGFSRAELLAVIESLRPLDATILSGQDSLFARADDDAPEARAALLRLLDQPPPPAGMVSYTSLRYYNHHAAEDSRHDPYHTSFSLATIRYEVWSLSADTGEAVLLRISNPEDSSSYLQFFSAGPQAWSYNSQADALTIRPNEGLGRPESADMLQIATMYLLTQRDGRLQISADGSLISHSVPLDHNSPDYLQAIQAVAKTSAVSSEGDFQRTIELRLDPDGLPIELRVMVAPSTDQPVTIMFQDESAPQQDQIQLITERLAAGVTLTSLEQIEQRQIALAEAPLALRDGQPPQALIIRDYRTPTPTEIFRFSPESLVGALSMAGAPYYALPADQATLSSLEINLSGRQANSAPSDPGEPLLETAVSVGLATRTIYTAPGPDEGGTLLIQVVQGEARHLGAFLASAESVPWDRSDPLRLSIAGRDINAWEASGFGARYLLAEVDGQLLIITTSDSAPADMFYALASRLQLVE